MSDASVAPAALSAFLQGVERRAWMLAWAQSGSVAAAERALLGALRAFRTQAPGWPLADWPERFWKLLAATPAMRQPTSDARWPVPLRHLAVLAMPARLGLLLRLVAGLQEAGAAAVMGIDGIAYRRLLAEACPRDAAGDPDAAAWRALAEQLQLQLRELPPDRLDALVQLREAALSGVPPVRSAAKVATSATPVPPMPIPAVPRRPAWPWRLIVLVVLACALALGLTWFWPGRVPGLPSALSEPGLGDESPVLVESLPEQEPATAPEVDPAMHPDRELLADPEAATIAREADFYAWYAAGAPLPRPDAEMPPPSTTPDLPETAEESNDAAL